MRYYIALIDYFAAAFVGWYCNYVVDLPLVFILLMFICENLIILYDFIAEGKKGEIIGYICGAIPSRGIFKIKSEKHEKQTMK